MENNENIIQNQYSYNESNLNTKQAMEQKRRKRINRIKVAIILTVVALIIIPTILCVFLGFKVSRLQNEVDQLTAIHNENKTSQNYDKSLAYAAEKEETTDKGEDNSQSVADTVNKEGLKDVAQSDPGKQDTTKNVKKNTGIYSGKKIYLTFDDGPSKYTNEILDILGEYNAKATFFVIGKTDEASKKEYKRIVKDGHTLGMHSYSHKYNVIYKSVEDFDKDFTKLWNLLYDTTGYKPKIYRFPGGSGNMVNKHGMDQFIKYLNKKSIVYFDWNVVNGDATNIKYTKKQLVKNILDDVAKRDNSVVLMHDTNQKKATVDSLKQLLDALTAGGAQILPLNEKIPPIQMIKADTIQ